MRRSLGLSKLFYHIRKLNPRIKISDCMKKSFIKFEPAVMPNHISDIPQEILDNIFSRLPTKSVGKCRCVSKYWRTYLSTPLFINLHLHTRKTHDKEDIIFTTPFESLQIITFTSNITVAPRQIQLANISLKSMCGSCNGLVLLQDRGHDMFLVNPVTHQQLQLPYIIYLHDPRTFRMIGFGYDRSRDDYKVALFTWYPCRHPLENKHNPLMAVYSVRRGAWRVVDISPCVRPPDNRSQFMCFLNGSLHWLAIREVGAHIVSFDLEYEVFREIPLSIEFSDNQANGLFVLDGCLCVVVIDNMRNRNMWMMKKYGVVDSWIRYRMKTNGNLLNITPLCFVSDDELLYLLCDRGWMVYNFKEQTHTKKDLVVGVVPYYFENVGLFVDSLVSLDQYAASG